MKRTPNPQALTKAEASARRLLAAKKVRDSLQRQTRKLLSQYDADLVMFALEGCWDIAHQHREKQDD